MQRNRAIVALFLSLALLGCKRSPGLVFVDLDGLISDQKSSTYQGAPLPVPPPAREGISKSVLGAPAVALDDPANRPKQSVQEMFDASQATAFKELEKRLRKLYRGQAKEFSLLEEKSLARNEQDAYSIANDKIRIVFDSWATERAPIFAQLALIEGFPLPRTGSTPPNTSASAEQTLRTAQAEKLRNTLADIDAKFHLDTASILGAVRQESAQDKKMLEAKVKKYASDLEEAAELEAKAQIREAVSRLRFQLADPTPINFPEMHAKQVSIPAEKPLDAAPSASLGGILGGKQEQRRLLEHELRIWLALNRYSLAEKRQGGRDATLEFQIWRQQHGAGP